MMTIPLNSTTFGEQEINAAIEVLRSDRLTMGPRCAAFEEAFARTMRGGEAVFVNSGSSANLLVFFALANHAAPRLPGKRPCEPGAEVIVPAVTWSTTIWPIVQAGLTPVLVDSDPLTLQMDLDVAAAAITDRTAAICAVHVLGNATPVQELNDLAERHGLWLVEDTCEALGVRRHGRFTGTTGQAGTFSFFFSHHITTVEGGMILTSEPALAELLRALRAHGWTRHLKNRVQVEAMYPDIDPRFLFINTGFNVRPTEINAAFGLVQLNKLQYFHERRRDIVAEWTERFSPLIRDGVFYPIRETAGTEASWFGYPVICRDRTTRDRLRSHLDAAGVETRPIICGNMARQPAFRNVRHRIAGDLRGADIIMDRGLLWGTHPLLSREEIDYVAQAVLSFEVEQ